MDSSNEVKTGKKPDIKKQLKEIHTKKPYLELVAALLTVPVLITVLLLNINNLKGDDSKKDDTSSKNQTIVITQPDNTETKEKEVVITKEACKPGIGDIQISSPEEGENVSDNPVNVDVNYDANGYCAVVWSYRVNSGNWSSYDDSAISLYNLSNGNVKLELRVKSVVDSSQENYTRNFTYTGASITPANTPPITPTPTQ